MAWYNQKTIAEAQQKQEITDIEEIFIQFYLVSMTECKFLSHCCQEERYMYKELLNNKKAIRQYK
jgi:hypothetical protein